MDNPVSLPVGKPDNPCEHENFVEVVPTKVFASATSHLGSGWYETVEHAPTGMGLYRGGKLLSLPSALRDIAPSVADRLQLRLDPIGSKLATANGWRVWGSIASISLAVLSLPFAYGFANSGGGSTGMLVGMGVTLGGSLLSALVTLVVRLALTPTAMERVYYDVRAQVLLPSEQDTQAVATAVNRHNKSVRANCR